MGFAIQRDRDRAEDRPAPEERGRQRCPSAGGPPGRVLSRSEDLGEQPLQVGVTGVPAGTLPVSLLVHDDHGDGHWPERCLDFLHELAE